MGYCRAGQRLLSSQRHGTSDPGELAVLQPEYWIHGQRAHRDQGKYREHPDPTHGDSGQRDRRVLAVPADAGAGIWKKNSNRPR